MNIITKKVDKYYYNLILKGNKNFELRKEDDCRYSTDDILILKEINAFKEYTERIAICRITCVLRDYEGLKVGYVILGIKLIKSLDLSIGGTEWIKHYLIYYAPSYYLKD